MREYKKNIEGEKMLKRHANWELTEDELDRLEDAFADGIIPKSEVMNNRENFKNGLLSVGKLIDIWSNDDVMMNINPPYK